MLTLNDGRKEMYQWDIGRIATIDVECDVVHFSNLKYGASLSVEVKNGEVAIPNKLLTSGEPIYCWAFVADANGKYTKQEQTLNVNKRAKQSDYVYTETETLTWKSLDERITELEKGVTVSTMTGATADTDGAAGLVPAPKAGQHGKFLRGDGTWADVPQGGGGGTGNGDMQKTVYDPMGKATDVFAYAENTAESKVSAHNTESGSHSDIRELITGLTNRLNALADSDDTTLDQLSEIVAYIKSNKSLIDAITTNKVSVSDIVDNLTSSATNKPLSAAQGKALKTLIDAITIPEKLPNPNALIFTGAVTGSYDGSSPLTVNIQSGGGGDDNPWRLIKTVILTETVKSITVDTDNDNNAFALSEIYVNTNATNSSDQTNNTNVGFNINGKKTVNIGTNSPMSLPCGKTEESGRNWIWIMSLNPFRAIHGSWLTSSTSSGKTVYCYQANEFNDINPNPHSMGERITSVEILGITSTSFLSAGSEFRIYGR